MRSMMAVTLTASTGAPCASSSAHPTPSAPRTAWLPTTE
ncbi:Uncharacterised protein [Bordetella pertussis]|nr:Uncharacterised protein [Bordetella pertussis]